MRYAKLMMNDTVDTDSGICVSIWLQGCHFHCKGCHNPETWDFNGGEEIYEPLLMDNIANALTAHGIKRNLSILGGEPLCDENFGFTCRLIGFIKNLLPKVKIYLWTGFEECELADDPKFQYILDTVDVLITGRFVQSQRDITLPLRGSTNQLVWRRNQEGVLVLDVDNSIK